MRTRSPRSASWGATYTGEYEPIAAIHDAVAEVNDRNGWEVPIHVDAASGGFVAPFLEPDLNWDFRLPLVKSINVSGHKYGLVYPGIGWVAHRDRADLPEDLIFHVSYLGGDEATFNLNFSSGASQVIAQYYNFLRLGQEGYRRIMTNLRSTADYLAEAPGRDRPVHPAGRPPLAPPGRLPTRGAATLHGLRHRRTPPSVRLDRPGVPPAGERRRGHAASARRPASTSATTWPTCSSTT